MRRWVGVVVSILVLGALLVDRPATGQSNADERIDALETRVAVLEAGAGIDTTASEVGAPRTETSGVGVAVESGNWTLTAVGSEFVTSAAPGSAIDVTTNGQFLVVYFNITNNSAGPAKFPFTGTTVTDGQGRTFTANEQATVAFQVTVYGETPRVLQMQPGIPYDYAILFEVPPDDSGFTFSDGTVKIPLGI